MFLIVYVDDILVTGSSEELLKELKQYLHRAFTIKDLSFAKFFLGLEVARSSKGIYINQRKYILDIVKDTSLQHAKDADTPLPKGLII